MSIQNNTTELQAILEAVNSLPENRTPSLKAITITDNGTYTPESGVDGFSSVTVAIWVNNPDVTVIDNLAEKLTETEEMLDIITEGETLDENTN